MRGWWSARPRAKIWDSGAGPSAEPRPSATLPAPEAALEAPVPAETAAVAEAVDVVSIPEPVTAPEPSEAVALGELPAESQAELPTDPPAEPAVAVEAVAPTEAALVAASASPESAYAAPDPWSEASGPPLAALFDPRPDDFSAPTAVPQAAATPVLVTIAESPYYERSSLGTPDPAPAPVIPATGSNIDAPKPDAPNFDSQGEFLRLLEVVTSMCDHVIEYIEADRAERRQMMEMLTQLGRVITEGSAAAVAAFTALSNANAGRPLDVPTSAAPATDAEPRERIIGGSMPAGPEPHVDLVVAESSPDLTALASAKIHIAVEVRGQFGDRWVDGFEICEVMTTPSGPRYRLRRQRDGVVLPELFDATSIRHVETAEAARASSANGWQSSGGASGTTPATDASAPDATDATDATDDPQTSRERSMGSHPSGTNGDAPPVNGSGYWSRS